jgi:hypothetical protein
MHLDHNIIIFLVSNMGSSKVEACVELMIPLTPS